MCVCLCALCRNPNHWTDLNENWHRGGPQGGRFLGGGGDDLVPLTPLLQGV